jgi:hypothetical protein
MNGLDADGHYPLEWDYDPERVADILGEQYGVRGDDARSEAEEYADQAYLYYHNGGMF